MSSGRSSIPWTHEPPIIGPGDRLRAHRHLDRARACASTASTCTSTTSAGPTSSSPSHAARGARSRWPRPTSSSSRCRRPTSSTPWHTRSRPGRTPSSPTSPASSPTSPRASPHCPARTATSAATRWPAASGPDRWPHRAGCSRVARGPSLRSTGRATEAVDARVESVAELVGAVPITMDAATHDRAVALVSHVPHVLSVLAAARLADAPQSHLSLAGAGLRDVTRIAGQRLRPVVRHPAQQRRRGAPSCSNACATTSMA